MKWAISLKTDAVLTNDPEKYLALKDHKPSILDYPQNWSFRNWWTVYFWSWLGATIMNIRVWRYSGRGGWNMKLGNVEERVIKGGIPEKAQEIKD